MPVEALRQSPMMAHMLDALDNGEDIGHYGRLVFAMIGRHFVSNDELVGLLTQDQDTDEQEIRVSCSRWRRRATARQGVRRSWSITASRTSRSAPIPTTLTPATYTRTAVPRRSLRDYSRVQGGAGLAPWAPRSFIAKAACGSGEVVGET